LSLQWEPEWEPVVIEYHGIRLRVLRDRVTGLLACPICGTGDNATYLFTSKDLVYHILAHARKAERHRASVQYHVVAEEEEE
jgi:hypothetical protein